MTDDDLFNEYDLGRLAACFVDTGRTPSRDELISFFHQLPDNIQDTARAWGLSDSPVQDSLCEWMAENRHRLATMPLPPRPSWRDVLVARNGAKAEAVVDAAAALGYPFVVIQDRLYRVVGNDVKETGCTIKDVH